MAFTGRKYAAKRTEDHILRFTIWSFELAGRNPSAVLRGRLPPIDSPYARRQLAIVATAGPRLISGLTMR
jgi:hypothetical protein